MTTTYWVTRDAANPRDDENAAMAHVQIYKGDDLADARFHLTQYLIKEANGLAADAPRTVQVRDAWRFERIAGLLAAADTVEQMDPLASPTTHKTVTRTVGGLLFRITAIEG